MERAIADYLLDHEGGNSSQKTLQWHQTALGLLRRFLEDERGITLVGFDMIRCPVAEIFRAQGRLTSAGLPGAIWTTRWVRCAG